MDKNPAGTTSSADIEKRNLYIVLISVHGLIRGDNLELGRDADTGGQIKYVVELAQALAEHPAVGRVDLLTRRVVDDEISGDYAQRCQAWMEQRFGAPRVLLTHSCTAALEMAALLFDVAKGDEVILPVCHRVRVGSSPTSAPWTHHTLGSRLRAALTTAST